MGKILHILTDEKFTDYVISQFKAPEMHSEFVLIPTNFLKGESEVKQLNKVRTIRYPSEDFDDLLSHLSDYTGIVLHGLFWRFDEDILRAVPNHVKVAWMFWGGEIYSRSDLEFTLLAPLTRFFEYCHCKVKKIKHTTWELPIELFQRIDYCLTGIDEEFVYAKHYLRSSRLQHLWYTYYSIEETVGSLINERCCGKDIIFCNSAAIENSMYDAILRLYLPWNKRKLHRGILIMPLSYGAPWVKNCMLKWGAKLFGEQFVPLTTFMPRNEYNKIFLNCGTLILPYWSPAGQGNILTALWLGMRVYLSEKSMAYTFFKRLGANVFSFESDFNKYGCSPITEEEFQQNRSVLTKWYSKEHVMQAVKDVVDKLQ